MSILNAKSPEEEKEILREKLNYYATHEKNIGQRDEEHFFECAQHVGIQIESRGKSETK